MNKVYKQSMEVGYYFKKELYRDERTDEWSCSEECSVFTKMVLDYAEENECDINFAFYELMDDVVNKINDKTINMKDHMWDDYCKGFLASEILGMPTKENLKKVQKAEILWRDVDTYGYYHEVLEEVK